jgi:hypothetical protein
MVKVEPRQNRRVFASLPWQDGFLGYQEYILHSEDGFGTVGHAGSYSDMV